MSKELTEAGLKTVDNDELESEEGYFRSVKVFKHNGRKYVFKIDRLPNINLGCLAETQTFHSAYGKCAENIVAPVLDHGKLDNHFWVIMPYLRTIKKVLHYRDLHRKIEYLRYAIFPQLKKRDLRLKWNEELGDRMMHPLLGDDIHFNNVGVNNRGQWFILDYGLFREQLDDFENDNNSYEEYHEYC